MKSLLLVLLTVPTLAMADLGISDTVSETSAKNGAAGLGVTQVYDHPADVPNGQFVVPIQYNRTTPEGNGTEHDANDSKPNDIDYVPLSQLKGASGAAGATGSTGNTGVKGDTGATGQKGNDGKDGKDGLNGKDANIDGNTFINVGASVRWYDWKNVSLTSGYRYDLNHHEQTIDAMVIQLKLGKSFEDRKLSKLQDRVDRLERMLLRR